MCDIQNLLNFGVYGTEGTQEQNTSFVLNRTCSQIAEPFEQYCLIPPITRLEGTCLLLDDGNAPISLFQRIFNGQIRTLPDLPNIFQSFPDVGSSLLWIPLDPLIVKPNEVFEGGTYNGFRQLPNTITRLVVSGIASHQMLGFLGAGEDGELLQFYKMDDLGFLRHQVSTEGKFLETTTTDLFHNCFVNNDGSKMFTILNQICYTFDVGPNAWRQLDLSNQVRNVLLHNNDVVIISQTNVFFVEPTHVELTFPFIFWSCWTQDYRHIVVATFFNATTQLIYVINIDTGLFVMFWNLTQTLSITTPYVTACTLPVFNGIDPIFVRVTGGGIPANAQLIRLQPFVPSATTTPENLLTPRIFGDYYVDNNGIITDNTDGHIIPTFGPPGLLDPITTVLAPSPDGTDIWFVLNGILWNVHNESSFNIPPNIYLAFDVVVNDEYALPPPTEVWYLGRTFYTIPQNPPIPGVFRNSRHNHYRLFFDAVVTSPTHFPHVTSHVERANEFYLLTNFTTKVYEDANITVENHLDEVIWETNTHDQASDPTKFHTWISRLLPLSTTNGLYLVYFTPDVGIRLVYNVYNAPSFAKFCMQDIEFRARAMEQQRDFCFANLRVDPGTMPIFADSRCGCVGGTRLFEAVFPALTQLHSQTTGRMIADLPCLLTSCGDSFVDGPELSNTYNYVSEHCAQDINICTEIISLGANSNLSLNNLQLQQYCGADPQACLNNAACPIGSICVDGTCVLSCTSDAFCKTSMRNPVAVCTSSGRCEFPPDENAAQKNQTWLIVTIVCVILALVFLLIILGLFVKKK